MLISFDNVGFPPKWTRINKGGSFFSFLDFSNFFSNNFKDILNVLSSISTKSIFAPQNKAAFAEDTKVFGTVHTIFDLFISNAKQEM